MSHAWFQASAAIRKTSEFFWDVTQLWLAHNEILGPIYCPETSVTTNLHCVTSQKSKDLCSHSCWHFSLLLEKSFFWLAILCWYIATIDPPDLPLKQSYVCLIVLQLFVNKRDLYSLLTFPVPNLMPILRCVCRSKLPIQVPNASVTLLSLLGFNFISFVPTSNSETGGQPSAGLTWIFSILTYTPPPPPPQLKTAP